VSAAIAARQVDALVGPPRKTELAMNHPTSRRDGPRARRLTARAFATIEHFLHIEAVSGVVLVLAATIALIAANSHLAHSYHAIWELPISMGVGEFVFSRSLHFWINDILMTFFFLLVGMEIRREIHEGALQDLRQALLPVIAACGGVLAPAAVYLSINFDPIGRRGWAVPTATDIAFAVGVLAMLGRLIPDGVRVLLLALAIIDDIIAILIIAFFYSEGLEPVGFLVAGLGVFSVLCLQRLGFGSAFAYLLPGAIIWLGLLMSGAHPTLAGVVLGVLTPVNSLSMRQRPLAVVSRLINQLLKQDPAASNDRDRLAKSLRPLRVAQRELLPPVVRVQAALHLWVAYGIIPLFALANAGVSLGVNGFADKGSLNVLYGVVVALVVGKPLGIVGVSWLVVRMGICQLPPEVNWRGVILVGLLAGIGFTMSIFVSVLAFAEESTLNAAKVGILLGSLISAVLALLWGHFYIRSLLAESRESDRSKKRISVVD